MNAAPKEIGSAFFTGWLWLVWWGLLFILFRFSGGGEHPPTEEGELSRGRRLIAWATLLMFVLLFMPVPFRVH